MQVFDGHNDFLLRPWAEPGERNRIWRMGDGTGHIDAPRARAGGLAGGLCAIYLPSPPLDGVDQADFERLMDNPPYAMPLPPPLDLAPAQAMALGMAAQFLGLARDNADFTQCRTVAEIRAAMAAGQFAAVLHMEGAEAIDENLDALHLFHALGLRSLGPVWSRPTIFGHGVPFAFPSSPDTGPGLTEAGKRLVRECDGLGIMIDLSHLNEKGFDDIAAISSRPLIATHSNAHAVTPSARNLTNRQLSVIAESDGMVGLNFATAFLRDDGRRDPAMGFEPMLRHLDHLIAHLGEDRVGLGSDFDGATIPEVIGDAAGLPAFFDALRRHGYDDALLAKLAHRNWLAALTRVWGA